MNGVKYLLDTNFVLEMLKSTLEVLATAADGEGFATVSSPIPLHAHC